MLLNNSIVLFPLLWSTKISVFESSYNVHVCDIKKERLVMVFLSRSRSSKGYETRLSISIPPQQKDH